MDIALRDKFLTLWRKYFNNADLPITFYYTDADDRASSPPADAPRCIIGALAGVRSGNSLACDAQTVGCPGGKRYLGFAESITPNFEYFLSYGIPGRLRGERYVKTPEMVKKIQEQSSAFKAPAKYIIFKRWDKLETTDEPVVVIFFAIPDVLAGLFTLARYDETARDPVIAPFGSGCSTIVQYPYLEKDAERPRAVIGMFDPSARPFVPQETVSFAVPFNKFTRMVDNMEESFLITDSWARIQKRIP
jgi:uncharacterized protein (DUF169 family)